MMTGNIESHKKVYNAIKSIRELGSDTLIAVHKKTTARGYHSYDFYVMVDNQPYFINDYLFTLGFGKWNDHVVLNGLGLNVVEYLMKQVNDIANNVLSVSDEHVEIFKRYFIL